MNQDSKIFIAGSETLVGAAVVRALQSGGYSNVVQSYGQVDLRDAVQTAAFFEAERPEYVIVTAGRSGGILANQTYPADLMIDNLRVVSNVLPAAAQSGVRKLMYLASSCSYPKLAAQPLAVESILTGSLEPTNESYALAKLAGLKLCQAYRKQYGCNFIVGIPANDFGIGDDFSPNDSHVIAALLRRMHEAKEQGAASVSIWGSGAAQREFIFAEDLADAILFAMRAYDGPEPLNLGGGTTVSIRELAELVREVTGFPGELVFDSSKPDGMPFKSLDSSPLLALGWRPRTGLREALQQTYDWYVKEGIERQKTVQDNSEELANA